MTQIIYILKNEAMPGYIKIGKTNDLDRRVKELSRYSGVPLPFEVFYAAEVADMNFVEKQIHEAFGRTRVAENREFFYEEPERVVAALKLAVVKDLTPGGDIVEFVEDKVALEKVRRHKKRFDFERYGIKKGSVLTFTRDENIKCILVEDSNVDFNGEIVSLSKAAQKAMNVTRNLQGPIFWEYEGEILDERRKRMETEISLEEF